ncbi:GNAT family N-acetyltransferase [Leadbetterella byssophila]|uniref:GCN5-related N-acetyltransferase n=1 Tax=Leadbetterella byssophila (strain DSM 17132 / JCM 16389 / KACC 11308 / NBRC 106382 / 4M15) TaxID=649349 RepID=E4RTI7_LEAB4|nr:GNAT family N-acetyltransferase [Leadbetterella byssophila]ADQ16844.1 GCN5-related N-acetyltransferase [Leadbetterella byssophila DSM 17132]
MKTAHVQDIPFLQDLARRAWEVTYSPILERDQLNYMLGLFYSHEVLAQQITSGEQIYLIDDEGKGFISYQMNYPEVQKCKIHKLYLDPDQKGKGLGTAMIQEVVSRCQKEGMRELLLNVNKYNSAKVFYEKVGFVVKDEVVIDIGRGYIMDDYVMAYKNLTPPL